MVVIIFLLFFKLVFRFLMHYLVGILVELTGCNLFICVMRKLTLDIIELYEEPIVLFTDVLCNIAKSCMPITTSKQKNVVRPGLT